MSSIFVKTFVSSKRKLKKKILVPATIPTAQPHSSCAQRNRQLHRGDAVGQLSLVQCKRIEDAHPESQMVSMMLVQSATAKAVLAAAQTRAKLTLIIVTWHSHAVETHTSSLQRGHESLQLLTFSWSIPLI